MVDQIANAALRAAKRKETVFVVNGDEGDGRTDWLATQEFVDGPEFEAFDCRIVAVVEPDGTAEL